jgi:hypothetical protein
MRKYASIPPQVWQVDLKAVRGNLDAISVYFHLTTSGHANMIGLYYLPVAYIAHELGCPLEGASKGLIGLIEANICSYDFEQELVWVHNMATDQIAPQLSPKDKRVQGIAGQLAMLPICQITLAFFSKYRLPFHLNEERNLKEYELAFEENQEAPSKPLRSQKQEQEQEQKQEQDLETGTETFGFRREENFQSKRESSFTSYPVPPSPAEARLFLMSKNVPQSQMDECVQRMMNKDFSPYDLEGVLAGSAAA